MNFIQWLDEPSGFKNYQMLIYGTMMVFVTVMGLLMIKVLIT